MQRDLPQLLPLVCPRCRTRDERGWHMFTLSLLECFSEEDGEVAEGVLGCDNELCGRRYPVVAGIPIVPRDLGAFLPGALPGLLAPDLPALLLSLLIEGEPDTEVYPQLYEHLSIYLDAHYGDLSHPPPSGPGAGLGLSHLLARIEDRGAERVGRAVELGCGVGRALLALAAGADLVVGVDLHFAALSRARRLLRGERLPFARKMAGRCYEQAEVRPNFPRQTGVVLVCGDALDPPLVPGGFDRVAALNLLDSVREPRGLLRVMDGLCRPGGEIILSSPYAWQSGVVDEAARIPGNDPGAALASILRTGDGLGSAYAVEEEADVPWRLRRDQRSAQEYSVHYLRARKTCGGGP